MSYLIKDLPDTEKPREKFKTLGPNNLSNEELIAIILRTGTSDMSVKDLAIKISKEIKDITILSINDKITERAEAKKNKSFEVADSIRAELDEKGIILMDSADGTKWDIKALFSSQI